jgi:glycosyltransferase involved in cell wall biosynthesis
MQEKLKVLMCSEASFLNSGFGIYNKELLTRLHKTNKYTVAEFASYGFVNDPRDKDIHWTYYANAVKNEDSRHKAYSSRPDNQFGRWRFEKVLLDFKPDIVIDVRDYWMSSYQAISPLRNYFHWILMPTVDSEPQQEDWIDTFLSADAIFTYSDWAAKVLDKQSSGKINYIDTASPGVDLEKFNIKNRKEIRAKLGVPVDAFIVGSVMRNQKRKLIPELLIAFRIFLDKLGETKPELAQKSFLYLHTSYPDMGWDIPEILKDSRLANKVLFSYICKNCKSVSCNVYSGLHTVCPKCMNKSCVLPSVTHGYTTENLADIYNLMDLYVQYSICEGFGMPQVEASACGTPVATVNYSAMCDLIQKIEAFPIRIQTKFKELETKAMRVYPDNNDLAKIIFDFHRLPEPIRNKKRLRTRELTEKNYDWDAVSKKWERYLDKLDESGYRSNWSKPPEYQQSLQKNKIKSSQNFETILDICQNLLQNKDLAGTKRVLDILKNVDYGYAQNGPTQITAFNISEAYQYFETMINNHNQAEKIRSENPEIDEDFIVYAKLKNQQ